MLIFFCSSINTFSQISYSDIPFAMALQKAKSTKQLIFVQLLTDCEECNEVANKGLSNPAINKVYNTFICVQYKKGSSDYTLIEEKYRVKPIYPTSLMLDENGCFLAMMYDHSTTNSKEYIALAAEAMAIQKNPPLKKMNEKYQSEKYDTEFLKDYISNLNLFRFETDLLLDEYVGKLIIDSLSNPKTIEFIIQCTPPIDSRPYQLVRFNLSLYDSVFMALPLDKRKKINNLIISKSRKLAYRNKDEKYMRQVANFAKGTYGDNYEKGWETYNNNMLDFYYEIKDTLRFISNARMYYDQFLKKLDVDSLSKEERNRFIKTEDGRIIKSGKMLETGNQINKLAWAIYEFTDDPEYLGMVQKWAERILVYENPAYHDTYAHILYKLGAKQKAIEWQEKAIEIGNTRLYPTEKLEIELEKMKKGEL